MARKVETPAYLLRGSPIPPDTRSPTETRKKKKHKVRTPSPDTSDSDATTRAYQSRDPSPVTSINTQLTSPLLQPNVPQLKLLYNRPPRTPSCLYQLDQLVESLNLTNSEWSKLHDLLRFIFFKEKALTKLALNSTPQKQIFCKLMEYYLLCVDVNIRNHLCDPECQGFNFWVLYTICVKIKLEVKDCIRRGEGYGKKMPENYREIKDVLEQKVMEELEMDMDGLDESSEDLGINDFEDGGEEKVQPKPRTKIKVDLDGSPKPSSPDNSYLISTDEETEEEIKAEMKAELGMSKKHGALFWIAWLLGIILVFLLGAKIHEQ